MGNHQHRFAGQYIRAFGQEILLSLRVKHGGGLIEHNDGRVFQQGSGQ